MRFHCNCLNVNIDVLDAKDDQQTLKQFEPVDLAQILNKSHEWFVCDVPTEQSVHITWQSFTQTIFIRDMKINRCLVCNLYTHVTNIGPSRMLINKELVNENDVKNLYCDPNYSKIAKIILPNSINSTNITRLSTLQNENIQRECEFAQQIYRQTIEDLEQETEEKIRMYQREQEQLLDTKTEEIKKQLNGFLNLIHSVSKQTSNAKLSPTLQPSSSYINENSTESGFGSDIFDGTATDTGRFSSNFERPLSERTSNIDEETNDDPMIDNRNWYDDSSSSNFAKSVPKSIIFPLSSNYIIPHSNDDDGNDDLERIGKSFRDLSRSMCSDGTELFGDLPSPRLNNRPT